jgi:hypothetical protein
MRQAWRYRRKWRKDKGRGEWQAKLLGSGTRILVQ